MLWCQEHDVDPCAPSSIKLSEYLCFLFRVKKLSPSSVKGHKAAISTTIRQMGGPSFSEDPLLRDVIKGMSAESTRFPRRFPSWDLYPVLSSLRLPPYEPLESCPLDLLSEKTAFLVSLASARRCSEVHAFSFRSLAREPGGAISLRFCSGFVAKNQKDGTVVPPVIIKSLENILCEDDEDRTLCPVRALKIYKRRTTHLRSPNKLRLFVSVREDITRDISVATISRWLRNVIRRAYVASGSSPNPLDCRAHEIRAWASSMAWAHNVSLSNIMDAAYWHSRATFIQFYLREVSRLNQDGSRGISSVVVAQQAISSSSTAKRR